MLQSPSLLGVVTEALTAISKGWEGGTEDIETTLRVRGFFFLKETTAFWRRRRWLTVAETAHAETWTLTADIAGVLLSTSVMLMMLRSAFGSCDVYVSLYNVSTSTYFLTKTYLQKTKNKK